MQTSLWSPAGSFDSLLVGCSTDGSACTRDEWTPMWIGTDRADVSGVRQSLSNGDGSKVENAATTEPLVAEHLDSTRVIWNTFQLLMACSTFQTFARPIDEDEMLIAQLRAEARSRRESSCDSEPYFVRPRCHTPALGRFLARDPL